MLKVWWIGLGIGGESKDCVVVVWGVGWDEGLCEVVVGYLCEFCCLGFVEMCVCGDDVDCCVLCCLILCCLFLGCFILGCIGWRYVGFL